jgi:hypothetical protein
MAGVEVVTEISGVEDVGKFGTAVLRVSAQVLVELVEGTELFLEIFEARSGLVGIGSLELDSDCAFLARRLEQWEQVRCQRDVSDMIDSDMSVHPIVCELAGHDSSRGIQTHNVQAVSLIPDLLGDIRDFCQVGKIALEPYNTIGVLRSQLLAERLDSAILDFFGYGDDEEL